MKRLLAQNNAPLPMPRFADRLQDGERLLWEGQPNIGQFIRPKVAATCLLVLLLLLLFVLQAVGGRTPLPVILAISTSVWLLGGWFSTQNMKAQAVTAAYALTSRRLFIRRLERLTVRDYRLKIDEVPLGAIQPRLRSLGGDYGTITLGAPIWSYERALRAIPNAGAVFALLMQMQAALPVSEASEQPSGPYYAQTKPEARSETAWKLEDILRRGETVLWQGAMDAAQLDRAERAGFIALVVLLSGAGGIVLALNGWWTPLWQGLILVTVAAIGYPLARLSYTHTARNRRYALTSRRVLVIKNASNTHPKIEERELPETAKMRLARGRNGFGTIVFEKKTRVIGEAVETYEFSFKHTADAEAVFGQIGAARQGYFAASAPKSSAAASLGSQDGAQPN